MAIATATPATEKQRKFIGSLCTQIADVLGRMPGNDPAAVRATWATVADDLATRTANGELDRTAASGLINGLIATRDEYAKTAPVTATVTTTGHAYVYDIPDGHYAYDGEATDGEVVFFRVDRPTDGKWAGWTFIKTQHGDNYDRWMSAKPGQGFAKRSEILDAVAGDPKYYSLRYGKLLGVCGVCHRSLTDEGSRAAGIGPVCAVKMGW